MVHALSLSLCHYFIFALATIVLPIDFSINPLPPIILPHPTIDASASVEKHRESAGKTSYQYSGLSRAEQLQLAPCILPTPHHRHAVHKNGRNTPMSPVYGVLSWYGGGSRIWEEHIRRRRMFHWVSLTTLRPKLSSVPVSFKSSTPTLGLLRFMQITGTRTGAIATLARTGRGRLRQ